MGELPTDDMAAFDIDAGARQGPFLDAPGAMRRAMNWFFADKDRLFWILQVGGWFGFFLFHVFSVSTLFAGRSPESIAFSATSAFVGFLTTSILFRPAFRAARRMGPAAMLGVAISAIVLMTVAMAAIKAIAIIKIFAFGPDWYHARTTALGTDNFLLALTPDMPNNLFLLLSWAGLYFGINYYLTLRTETERALQSARLADQAQLKMLRYQLNPHFLFNTLNAVSTLVLEKDGRQANEMLTKLSAFLRYSLDSDPLQRVTLAEELRALELYLEIERTRFGERLHFDKQIEESTRGALVPSLLIQPAIENAIKYAIAKMEAGGKIRILARRDADMLLLQVCDNGPEAPGDPGALLETGETGVGLVNMRDRLAYLYGENCDFSLSRSELGGLCVAMRFPFQTRGRP
ncbi:MAG: histidine kinase [Pseudomonadota bacterium]